MVCFCKDTAARLSLLLPSLDVSAELDFDTDVEAIADILVGFGLPSVPWTPQSSWLELELPSLSLSASAIATISAAAQLRAQVQATLGLDLLIPGQANAFARLAATMSARLSALAEANLSLGLGVWPHLAATLSAVARLEAALSAGIFLSPPSGASGEWQPFLIQLRAVLPMISLSANLGLDLSADFTAELAASISAIVRIGMPEIPVGTMSFMACLSASLNAVAQLTASLGVNPLEVGLPTIQAMISARLSAVARLTMSTLGFGLPDLLALLPQLRLTFNPSFATSASVSAVMSLNAQAMASLDWQVPIAASLPVLTIGLPAISLSAQMTAAFGLSASVSPCGPLCDAGALLSAMAGGAGGIAAGLTPGLTGGVSGGAAVGLSAGLT